MVAFHPVDRINPKTQEANKTKVVWGVFPQPKWTCKSHASINFWSSIQCRTAREDVQSSQANYSINYSPEQMIPNLFVRLQAEKEMGLHSDDASQQQDEISNLAKSLPPPTNTRIPLHLVKQHNSDWQAHLQRISDFLL